MQTSCNFTQSHFCLIRFHLPAHELMGRAWFQYEVISQSPAFCSGLQPPDSLNKLEVSPTVCSEIWNPDFLPGALTYWYLFYGSNLYVSFKHYNLPTWFFSLQPLPLPSQRRRRPRRNSVLGESNGQYSGSTGALSSTKNCEGTRREPAQHWAPGGRTAENSTLRQLHKTWKNGVQAYFKYPLIESTCWNQARMCRPGMLECVLTEHSWFPKS